MTGRVWRGTAFGGTRGRTQLPGYVDRYMKGRITLELMHRGDAIRSVVRYTRQLPVSRASA